VVECALTGANTSLIRGIPYSSDSYMQVTGVAGDPERKRLHAQKLRELLIELGPIFMKIGEQWVVLNDCLPQDLLMDLFICRHQAKPYQTGPTSCLQYIVKNWSSFRTQWGPSPTERRSPSSRRSSTDRSVLTQLPTSIHGFLPPTVCLTRSALPTVQASEVYDFEGSGPVASASLGQVYKARLKGNGRQVAVKVSLGVYSSFLPAPELCSCHVSPTRPFPLPPPHRCSARRPSRWPPSTWPSSGRGQGGSSRSVKA
jgi:hypothetical protein